jgi:hypothetical protein
MVASRSWTTGKHKAVEASTSVEVLRAQRAYNQPRALPFVNLPVNGISRAEPLAG